MAEGKVKDWADLSIEELDWIQCEYEDYRIRERPDWEPPGFEDFQETYLRPERLIPTVTHIKNEEK